MSRRQELVDVRCGVGGTLAGLPVARQVRLGGCLGQALGEERGERGEFVGDVANIGGEAHGERRRRALRGRGERGRVVQGVAALDRGPGGDHERGEQLWYPVLTGAGHQADDLERVEPCVEQAGNGGAAGYPRL